MRINIDGVEFDPTHMEIKDNCIRVYFVSGMCCEIKIKDYMTETVIKRFKAGDRHIDSDEYEILEYKNGEQTYGISD